LYEGGSYEASTRSDVNRSKLHEIFFEGSSGMFISSCVLSYKQRFSRFYRRLYCFSEKQLLYQFITAPF